MTTRKPYADDSLLGRLSDRGVNALSDVELLAVVAGAPHATQVDAFRHMVSQAGSLQAVVYAEEGTGSEGMSEAQRARVAAAIELSRRCLYEELAQRPSLGNPRDSGDYLRARMRHLPYEVFGCLFLDNRHRVISFKEIFRGTIDGASVHPREVVREAIKCNAAAVIFSHNHPSGVAEPSAADRAITHELRDALQLVGVRVLDHLVIGSGEPVSMAARGLM